MSSVGNTDESIHDTDILSVQLELHAEVGVEVEAILEVHVGVDVNLAVQTRHNEPSVVKNHLSHQHPQSFRCASGWL